MNLDSGNAAEIKKEMKAMKNAAAETREYENLPGERWSQLKAMAISPRHYRHGIDTEDESESKAMRLGTALHTMVLEPATFMDRHPVFAGSRRGKAWDEFKAAHPDRDILTEPEWFVVHGMAESITTHPLAMEHLRHGLKERVLQWTDADTGLQCKGRCDSVNGHLVELKTCNGMSFPHEKFESHAVRLGYHGQLAFYSDGLAAEGYEPDMEPTMIVVESAPPFDVAVYSVKPEIIEAGRAMYKALLQRVKECTGSGQWPGVCGAEPLYLGLPAWAQQDVLPKVTFGGKEAAL